MKTDVKVVRLHIHYSEKKRGARKQGDASSVPAARNPGNNLFINTYEAYEIIRQTNYVLQI